MIIEAQSLSLKSKNTEFLPLVPVYWISRGEEYWHIEAQFRVQEWLRKQGYQKPPQAAEEGNQNTLLADLFSDRHLCAITVSGQSIAALKQSIELAFQQGEPATMSKVYVVSTPDLSFTQIKHLQIKESWLSPCFEKICFLIPKVLNGQDYFRWARAYVHFLQLNIQPEALQRLLNDTLNNPLALKQACFKAKILQSQGATCLNLMDVGAILDNESRYQPWDWLKMLGALKQDQALKILGELRRQFFDPILLLWHLSRGLEALLLFKASDQRSFYGEEPALARLKISRNQILDLLQLFPDLDAATKGLSKLPIWVILQLITQFLSSQDHHGVPFSVLYGLHSEDE